MKPWDRRNVATPSDTVEADLLAFWREKFDELRVGTDRICDRANAQMSVDREAFELFTDACDSMFEISFGGTP
jgi:hypothetical protein